jgi:hypothetical protein
MANSTSERLEGEFRSKLQGTGEGLTDGSETINSDVADSDEMQRQLLCGQQSEQRQETFEGTSNGSGTPCEDCDATNSDCPRLKEQRRSFTTEEKHEASQCGRWWDVEPDVGRVAHGVPKRVDRLKCLGNSVVPQIPYVIGLAIKETIENEQSIRND